MGCVRHVEAGKNASPQTIASASRLPNCLTIGAFVLHVQINFLKALRRAGVRSLNSCLRSLMQNCQLCPSHVPSWLLLSDFINVHSSGDLDGAIVPSEEETFCVWLLFNSWNTIFLLVYFFFSLWRNAQ